MSKHAAINPKNGAGAWGVVALGFMTLALAFTVRGSLSLAMPVWQSEFGWSRGFISGIAAVALLVMAVVAPFAGGLVDRRGSRPLLIFGLAAIGLGVALVAIAQPGVTAWLLPIGFAGIGAIGFGTIAQHVVAAAIAQRVEQNRGLAVGIGTAGSTAGQLLLMPVLAFFMQSGEWRTPFLLLALACFLLIPVTWRALSSRGPTSTAGDQLHGEADGRKGLRSDLGTLLRSPVFHAIFWSYTICGFTTSGVIETHLMPYASLCGFGPVPSAAAYGVLSALNLAGMIAAGWLSDRVHRPLLLAFIYTARAGAFFLLLFVADNYPLLIIFAIVFGLFDYSTVPVTASYLASRLGIRVLGLSMGLLSAGHAVGGAAGAWAGGAVFDWSGGYGVLWTASIGLAVIAALLVVALGDNERTIRRIPATA
ncbi:MAG: MFS transporter [Thiobacillus sp.]|nr:MFS transporter [Thiobacillus sp.]